MSCQKAGKRKDHYGFFADMEPAVIETHSCGRGQICNDSILRPDIHPETMDEATGPFYVNGISTGDVLVLEMMHSGMTAKA